MASFDTKIQGTSEIAWNSAVGQGKKKKKKVLKVSCDVLFFLKFPFTQILSSCPMLSPAGYLKNRCQIYSAGHGIIGF